MSHRSVVRTFAHLPPHLSRSAAVEVSADRSVGRRPLIHAPAPTVGHGPWMLGVLPTIERTGTQGVRSAYHRVMALYGEVLEVERLTPHMVRVVLGGDGLAEFTPTAVHRPVRQRPVRAARCARTTCPFDPDVAQKGAPEHRPRGPPLHDPLVGPGDPAG